MDRWVGRVAIVTGASAGIGATIASHLVKNGMKVVSVARRDAPIKALAAELGKVKGELHAVQGDVTKEEDVVRVVKWTRDNLGGADVLVNNAGTMHLCPLTDCETEKVKQILDLNLLGLCMFTREVIKDMRSRGVDDGHIFHIGSSLGHTIVDFPGFHVYSATKHAVCVLTEGLRRELRDLKTKIKVTEISPGLVETDLAVRITGSLANQPYLAPEDVSAALLYALATPPHVQVHEILLHPLGKPAPIGIK